jgi:hypothetical protein
MKANPLIPTPDCRFILYRNVNRHITINVRFEGDNVWLTQRQIATLFHTTRANVAQHIRNIYQTIELQQERTCKKFLQVQKEGKRSVQRNITHYNIDMIIAIGYRVKSPVTTQFRQWVSQRRKQIVIEKKQHKMLVISKQ